MHVMSSYLSDVWRACCIGGVLKVQQRSAAAGSTSLVLYVNLQHYTAHTAHRPCKLREGIGMQGGSALLHHTALRTWVLFIPDRSQTTRGLGSSRLPSSERQKTRVICSPSLSSVTGTRRGFRGRDRVRAHVVWPVRSDASARAAQGRP